VLLLLLRLYYGTAFPLSFYVKSHLLTPYDAAYQALSKEGGRRQLLTWLAFMLPFLWIACSRPSRWGVALLSSALLFVAYHHASTIGVMGYHSRFFQPATIPIVLAAALAWPAFTAAKGVWLRAIPFLVAYPLVIRWMYRAEMTEAGKKGFSLGWLNAHFYVAFVIGVCLLVAASLLGRWSKFAIYAAPIGLLIGALHSLPGGPLPALDDEATVRRSQAKMNSMRGIYAVRDCLPEPVHIYHSELGVPGVLFPNSRITDLSGLMNPRLVFEQTRFDDLCLPDPPDVLFLPHRTHKRLNVEVKQSQCLRQFSHPKAIPMSSSTLYIRRDLLEAFNRCHASLGSD